MSRICKVLVIEDDDGVRSLLGDVFHDEGYEFTLVGSGTEMRDALDEDDYDVVIIDVSLRGSESGLVLADEARERGCGVIVMTGDPRQMAQVSASSWRSIVKPFHIEAMIALVDLVLQETEAKCMRRTRRDGTAFPARL
jgi:DNA-binding NtrC family response regulator